MLKQLKTIDDTKTLLDRTDLLNILGHKGISIDSVDPLSDISYLKAVASKRKSQLEVKSKCKRQTSMLNVFTA